MRSLVNVLCNDGTQGEALATTLQPLLLRAGVLACGGLQVLGKTYERVLMKTVVSATAENTEESASSKDNPEPPLPSPWLPADVSNLSLKIVEKDEVIAAALIHTFKKPLEVAGKSLSNVAPGKIAITGRQVCIAPIFAQIAMILSSMTNVSKIRTTGNLVSKAMKIGEVATCLTKAKAQLAEYLPGDEMAELVCALHAQELRRTREVVKAIGTQLRSLVEGAVDKAIEHITEEMNLCKKIEESDGALDGPALWKKVSKLQGTKDFKKAWEGAKTEIPKLEETFDAFKHMGLDFNMEFLENLLHGFEKHEKNVRCKLTLAGLTAAQGLWKALDDKTTRDGLAKSALCAIQALELPEGSTPSKVMLALTSCAETP